VYIIVYRRAKKIGFNYVWVVAFLVFAMILSPVWAKRLLKNDKEVKCILQQKKKTYENLPIPNFVVFASYNI